MYIIISDGEPLAEFETKELAQHELDDMRRDGFDGFITTMDTTIDCLEEF